MSHGLFGDWNIDENGPSLVGKIFIQSNKGNRLGGERSLRARYFSNGYCQSQFDPTGALYHRWAPCRGGCAHQWRRKSIGDYIWRKKQLTPENPFLNTYILSNMGEGQVPIRTGAIDNHTAGHTKCVDRG